MEVESGNENYDSRGGCNAIIETKTNSIIAGCQSTRIPDGVTAIADYAFAGRTGLTGTFIIPETVITIGSHAFIGCTGLAGNLTIPNSVTAIGDNAFAGCTGYDGTLSLGKSLSSIGTDAFKGTAFIGLNWNVAEFADAKGLLPENVKQLTIGNQVKMLPRNFMAGSQLTGSLVIPDSVTTIGPNAFYGCLDLNGTLSIGKSVNEIGTGALLYTNLEGVSVASSNTTFDSRGNCNAIIRTATSTLTRAFKKTTIPSTVKAIGEWAFAFQEHDIASLSIPSSVTAIGDYAFVYSTGLVGMVDLPATLTRIGDCAFYGCENVQNLRTGVADPSRVALGCLAFEGMNFRGCYLSVPAGSVAKYGQADQWRDFKNITEQGYHMPGDVNADGRVDVGDVNDIINSILGVATSDNLCAATDIDGNGNVDVSDVNETINLIFNQRDAKTGRSHETVGASSNRVKAEKLSEKVEVMLLKQQMMKSNCQTPSEK